MSRVEASNCGNLFSCKCRVRKENLARATEHESNGNNAAAYECYQKAVDISPSIAYDLIQVRKKAFLGILTVY